MIRKTEQAGILILEEPENALPVIFDSPHSGTAYPDDFNYNCDLNDLKRVEDTYVDELFSKAPHYGAALLCAQFPRSYIDVNRAVTDIDELLMHEPWPSEQLNPIAPTERSKAGIGLISRLIKPGKAIYNNKLTPDTIMHRIKTYYEPYHDTLRTLLDDAYEHHGQFWHVNCHSMPASTAYPKQNRYNKPSDIVLGTNDGQSCSKEFVYTLRAFWEKRGYRVTINDPFKGVELITRYAQPTQGKNSIQIEINRGLYMDEKTREKNANCAKLKQDCTDMIRLCCDHARQNQIPMAAD